MNSQQLRSSGEFSDLTIQVGDQLLRLHRFPLLSRSEYFRGLLRSGMADSAHVTLTGLPGGFRTMEMVADFCYGLDITGRFSTSNVGHLLCAASYLQMSGQDNLTELCHCELKTLIGAGAFNCLEILIHCSDVAPEAEQEGIVKQCIEGLVEHWDFPKHGHSEDVADTIEKWLKDINILPFHWVVLLLEHLQSRCDVMPLVIKLSAGYIDYILECHCQTSLHTLPEMKTVQPNCPDHCESITDPMKGQNSNMATDKQETESRLAGNDQPSEEENPNIRVANMRSNDSTGLQSVPFPFQFQSLSCDSDPNVLLEVFETILGYLPDDAPLLDVINVGWFVSIFHFAYRHCLQSANRLTATCASVYNHLVLQDILMLNPSSLSALNNFVRVKYDNWSEKVAELTDDYLKLQASKQSITASDVASLLETTAWCNRTSYERAFEALESLIGGSDVLLQEEIIKISNQIDLTLLSQDALERAAQNPCIPHEVTMKAAVSVSHRLRQELRKQEEETVELRCYADVLKETEAKLEKALYDAQEKQERINYLQRLRERMSSQLLEAELAPQKELAGVWMLETSQSHVDETGSTRPRLNFMAERNGATIMTIQPRGQEAVPLQDKETLRRPSEKHCFEFEMSQARTQRSPCVRPEVTGSDGTAEQQSSDRTKRRESENYQQLGLSQIRAKKGYFFLLSDVQATCNAGMEVIGAKWDSLKSSTSDVFPPFMVYDPDTCSLYTPVGRRLELKSWTKL